MTYRRPEAVKNIIGVKFKKEGNIYHFDVAGISLVKNDQVIVQTEDGPAMGTVITSVMTVEPEKLPPNLKCVIRKTTEEDLSTRKNNIDLEQQARQFCRQRIRDRNLPMKLIDVESLFDRSKLVFYFTAENRVDFRELVKDLVQRYKTRIELRQIGARHEARIIKGMGICGREICCVNLLNNLDRVSVKMAKEQSMSLNPEKISGLCGRLMCCLAYEYDMYQDAKNSAKNKKKCEDCPQQTGADRKPDGSEVRGSEKSRNNDHTSPATPRDARE
ncbi:MAG: stage 0 sporulation protein [Deltaproteobacteria bacterium]|nr:stage 0 sporulation protein [Deltaproteobacteria bacterium]